MLSRKLAIPAAILFALGSSAGGRFAHTAQAKQARADFSGTISITDYQVPAELGGGGAYLAAAAVDAELSNAMFDSATTFDNHGNFLADLATDVPTTANGGIKVVSGHEVITYHIKPNQKWSDGSAVTAADWIAPYLLNLSPDIGNEDPYSHIQTAALQGNDFVMTLKDIYAPAIQQLNPGPLPLGYMQKKYGVTLKGFNLNSFDDSQLIDPKTHLIKASLYESSGLKKLANAWLPDHWTSPSDLFNGPYKLKEWTPDQRYVLEPNTFYNALPADPKHPRPAIIQFVVVSENGATYIQDMSAQSTYNAIDKAEDFGLLDLPSLKSSKFTVTVPQALFYELLAFNVGPTYQGKANPLHDQRIRVAIQDSIDKYRYIKALYPGVSDPKSIALGTLIPSASPFSDKSIPQTAYDPATAKKLLAQAGYANTPGTGGNHLSLDYVTTTSSFRIRSGQLLQRQFAEVGINVRISYAQATGTKNALFGALPDGGILKRHNFEIAEFAFQTNPDAAETGLNLYKAQISGPTNPNGANTSAIDDPKLEAIWKNGDTTLDVNQRYKIYNQGQEIFYNQAYNISLYNRPNIVLSKGTIGNFKPNPTQTGYEWNAFEWFFDSTGKQQVAS